MTLSDSELYNVCNYLLDARKDRYRDTMHVSRPHRNDMDAPCLPAFDYLGSGRDREVWGYKDFAFKLQHPQATSGGNPNRVEYENYERIMQMTMPANMRVPVTRLIDIDDEPVIIMQRINGPTLEDMADWDDLPGVNYHDIVSGLNSLNLFDNADCNFIYEEATQIIYVLDLTT